MYNSNILLIDIDSLIYESYILLIYITIIYSLSYISYSFIYCLLISILIIFFLYMSSYSLAVQPVYIIYIDRLLIYRQAIIVQVILIIVYLYMGILILYIEQYSIRGCTKRSELHTLILNISGTTFPTEISTIVVLHFVKVLQVIHTKKERLYI